MMYVRPVADDDVDALIELFTDSGDRLNGMSSIRPEREFVAPRVARARKAWTDADPLPAENDYFLVLVDGATERVVGTSTIYSMIGLTEPFFSYRVGTQVAASRELGVYRRTRTLYLSNDYTGVAEVASLFLHHDYIGSGNGRLISLARMLFMAQHPDRFPDRVMAEMRGYQADDGSSPFWEGLGRHFFTLPFPEADRLSATGNKVFIAELMPRHPIYVPLLPDAAKEAIGQVHPNTEPARRLLESEGFRWQGYVDIFDGGASLDARIGDLRAVHESELEVVTEGIDLPEDDPLLIATTGVESFRCVVLPRYRIDAGRLEIDADTMRTLGVRGGDTVRVSPLRPGRSVL